jgi:hypothetical protein
MHRCMKWRCLLIFCHIELQIDLIASGASWANIFCYWNRERCHRVAWGECLCFNLQQERPRIVFAPTIQHCSKRDLECHYSVRNKNVSGCYTTNSGIKCSYGNGFHTAFRYRVPLMSNFSMYVGLKSNSSIAISNFKNTRAGLVPKLILSYGYRETERVCMCETKREI